MQRLNPSLVFSITPTLKDIPQTDWDNLFSQGPIEGYGYQKTLEEANLKEFLFGYLLARHFGKVVAIIPFFIMDFSFDTLIQGPIHNLILALQKIFKRFLKMKVLFLGSPTTEEFYLGISKNEDLPAFLDEALKYLRDFYGIQKIQGLVFNNLSEKNNVVIQYLKRKKFIKMEAFPSTVIKIEANSLEGYIKCLSRNTRKDLRKKLKKTAAQTQLRTEIRQDIQDIKDKIYSLYLNNFTDAEVRFETLTPEFFENICHNMPGVAKYFITYDKNRIVAFNLCLIKGNLFIDKFIGFDPEVAHKYHLYFATFCHNLDWCIKNGISFYQPGTTDYYPKLRLGAKLIPLYLYAKAFNPLLHYLIKLLAPIIQPKNLDSTLRDIEKLKKKAINPSPRFRN